MMKRSQWHLIFIHLRFLLLLVGQTLALFAAAQNPTTKITLSANTGRQPAKGQDTIRYQAAITNISDTAIFNLQINRAGDPNTTFVPGSFQSTPVAVPAAFPSILEDQSVALELHGIDPDGDVLDFEMVQLAQNGILGGIASISNTSATISYEPHADFSGTDQFTFSVHDNDGNYDTSAVLITVLPVNDAPSFQKGMDVMVLEDVGEQVFISWASNINPGAADEVTQALTFHILENNNAAIFSQAPSLTADGTLTFTVKENVSGTASISVNLQDDGGTDNGGIDTAVTVAFVVTVLPVNDAPSFQKGNDIVIASAPTVQTFLNWATAITAGPADESDQALTFIIESIDNPALFEEVPHVTADGTLIFKPIADAVGVANISIRLKDNGGTENSGTDVSDIQTFSITLEI